MGGPPEGRWVVERVAGAWLERSPTDADRAFDEARYGEQLEWGEAIPMVHRALAAPHVPATMVRLSRRTTLTYWGSLLHLLVYSFGWSNPAQGLARWYFRERREGRPEDPRLALIEAVWLEDGHLEEFLAQLVLMCDPDGLLPQELASVVGFGSPPKGPAQAQPTLKDLVPDDFVERTRAAVRRRMAEAARRDADDEHWSPITGGGDPLHLRSHIEGPLRRVEIPERTREQFVVDERAGRAVLQLDAMVGWYRTLAVLGAELPDRGGRSWRIDVHVATVGHLGTYRRSRDTGLWFAGRHREHLWGAG